MKLRIKEICKAKGLRMSDLAEKMCIDQANLTASLKGNPTLNRLKDVAKILGVRVQDLFGEEDGSQNICGHIEIDGKVHGIHSAEDLIAVSDEIASFPRIPRYTDISKLRKEVAAFIRRCIKQNNAMDSIYGYVGSKELFCLSCHSEWINEEGEEPFDNKIFTLTLMSSGKTMIEDLVEYMGQDDFIDIDSNLGIIKNIQNEIESVFESSESAMD